MDKKTTKSSNSRVCNIVGGIAEYFDIDATGLRILFAAPFSSHAAQVYFSMICYDTYAESIAL